MGNATIALFVAISLISQMLAALAVMQAVSTAEFSLAIPAWQALAALSAAAAYVRTLPDDTRRFQALAFSHCFVMCLFLSFVGQLLFVALTLRARLTRSTQPSSVGETLGRPKFDPRLLSQITFGRSQASTPARGGSAVGQARALIMNEGSLLDGPSQSFERWLEHNDEEIRLMAFGLRTMSENAVLQAIDETTRVLANASAAADKAKLHGRLADLHWQLLADGLVQSDMETMVVAACEEHANQAVALQPDRGQAWFVLGSCAIKRGCPQEAFHYFSLARQHHFPDALVLPGIAKAAFLQRDYGRVREALQPLRRGAPPLSKKGILEYWNP